MKWTALRLNMLPITAVEIQYACQTLTNIHNALVDAHQRQSLKSIQNFHIKPYFTPSQTFLSQSASKSSLKQSNKKFFQTQPMTYEKLFQQYQRLREQMSNHLNQLRKFYARNSQDQSASLFHMLRLKLERCLFDCNFSQNQTKKVMTKSQQEMKYNQIAKNFESNHSKSKLQSISQTQKQFLQSCQTFKTQNYTGYENESIQTSKNEFLQFDDESYEELFHQDKVENKNKKQYSKQSLDLSLQKRKNSISNTKRNSKQVTKKVSNSKIPLKRQPNSQLTIATLNQRQLSSQKINLTNIQNNEQKNYKNLKVLTNNNLSLKSTIKTNEILAKQNNPTTGQNTFNQSNLIKSSKNEKAKSYAALNQKREQQNKVINTQQQQKQKIIGKNQVNKQNEIKKNNTKKAQISPSSSTTTRNIIQQKSLSPNINEQSYQKTKIQQQQQPNKPTIDNNNNDFKEILMSKGSQLRFTIKMSREQYKSLLQLKSKMNEKKSN